MNFTFLRRKGRARCALLLGLLSGWIASAASGASESPARRNPVLVELFTSEGCSGCPPADKLLEQLDATQPITGALAIVLSEHVTYWNQQGWRDPFSLDEITERQKEYVDRFGLKDSHTPQMGVDGTEQFVGNDSRALTAAIEKAAKAPKQALVIENAHWENGVARFSVHGPVVSSARLVAVVAADATHSRLVVFLADRKTGRVLGAAEQALSR
jgi:hypothetical protein